MFKIIPFLMLWTIIGCHRNRDNFSSFAILLAATNKSSTSSLSSQCQEYIQLKSSDETVYYVSTTGNDNQTGKTESQAFRTFQKALSLAKPATTIYIASGTYVEPIYIYNLNGTQSQPITITTKSNQERTAIIDLNSNPLSYNSKTAGAYFTGGINVYKSSNIIIRGFTLKNVNKFGILIKDSSNVSVDNCFTDNTKHSGISSWLSHHISILSSEINQANQGGDQENLSIDQSTYITIQNNLVRNSAGGELSGTDYNGGEGIDIKNGSRCVRVLNNTIRDFQTSVKPAIYIDGYSRDTGYISIIGNKVYNNLGTGIYLGAEKGGPLHDVLIANNLSFKNSKNGIALMTTSDFNENSQVIENVQIVGNTFYLNGSKTWWGGIYIDNPAVKNIKITGNISANGNKFQYCVERGSKSQIYFAQNLLYGTILGSENCTVEEDARVLFKNIQANPNFTNPTTYDFTLISSSPAVDTGPDLSSYQVHTDFLDNKRPQGKGWDFGAFER